MWKVYTIQWKTPGQLWFQGKREMLKNPECKKCIQYSEKFQDNSVFQNKRKLLKNSECKKYIQYSEKFLGNSVFQGKRRCSKILNSEKYIHTVKNIRGTLYFFFRASTSYSKIMNCEKFSVQCIFTWGRSV